MAPMTSQPAGRVPRAGIYLRVSTEDQHEENQLTPLLSLCQLRGWEVHKVYRDVISGKTTDRMGLNEFMHDARLGEFQIAVFWAWDRITRRGAPAVLRFMQLWRGWNIAWESLQEPMMSSASDPHLAELLAGIIGWVAKQEAIRISRRTKEGMNRVRDGGGNVGRPKGAKDKKPRRRKRESPPPQPWEID